MRIVIFSLLITFFTFGLLAQEEALTKNKIVEDGKEYYLYEVKTSEGFMAIGRRFGVAYKDIIDANPEAVNNGLNVGQIIRIPIIEGRNTNLSEVKSDLFIYHIVEAGETLFFISRKYGVSNNDVIKNNPGSDGILTIGMELKIPKTTEAALAYQDVKLKKETQESINEKQIEQEENFIYHTVKPKETTYSIARIYNLSIQDIAKANPGIDSNNIPIGARLRIPNTEHVDLITSSEELTDTKYVYHRIKNGESLESIAALYKIPKEILNESNNLQQTLPPVGYMLKIPHSYGYTVDVAKEDEKLYTVKKKDDIRKIAEEYQVPIMNIQEANPQVKKWGKLKKGSKLTIPQLSVETIDTVINRAPEIKIQEDLALYFEQQEVPHNDTINIAFVLPLYLEHNDTVNYYYKEDPVTFKKIRTIKSIKTIEPKNPRFREFFLSSLVAINDLKEQGIIAKIKIYDAKKGFANMVRLLEDTTLAEADIIFGPAYPDHAKLMSDFCLKHHIRMVLPFVKECDELEENPYIYQVVPSKGVEYAHIARETANKYSNSNIIVVKGKNADERETLFSELLKSELYKPDSTLTREIAYKEINYDRDRMSGLSALIDPNKQNLIIIPAEKEKTYTLVIPVIDNYMKRNKDINIKLLGFSEWQRIKGRELENIFNVGCELYSPFYADPYVMNATTVEYINAFENYFNKYPTNIYPYYGMLGYDVTTYFLKGLHRYGNQLEANLSEIDNDGTCVEFNFERVNNWGGFVNTTLYNIEYNNEFDIKVIK